MRGCWNRAFNSRRKLLPSTAPKSAHFSHKNQTLSTKLLHFRQPSPQLSLPLQLVNYVINFHLLANFLCLGYFSLFFRNCSILAHKHYCNNKALIYWLLLEFRVGTYFQRTFSDHSKVTSGLLAQPSGEIGQIFALGKGRVFVELFMTINHPSRYNALQSAPAVLNMASWKGS